MIAGLEDFVYRCVDKYMAGRQHKRYGLVTAWDPDKHLAKATLQPEGQESGWLKVHSLHVGDGWGVMVGLTPGDGKTTGDQVEVTFQEGDFEYGAVTSRVHSVKDKPPKLEAGEILAKHKTGSEVFIDKKGKITIKDNKDTSIVWDQGELTIDAGDHDIKIKCASLKIEVTGKATVNDHEILTAG